MKITKAKIFNIIKKGIIGLFGLLAVVLVQDYFKSRKDKPPSETEIFQALTQAASEMNKTLPMMVDQETRIDNVTALTGRRIVYSYTLVNYSKEDIDTSLVIKETKPLLINLVRTEPRMETFRRLDVIVIYSYRDKTLQHVCDIAIKPEDYKK